MTPREYSARIVDLEHRVDHDLPAAMAAALNSGPGSGVWNQLGNVCREIGRLADELEGEIQ